MSEFLWRLAGANCAILSDSDKNSQRSFRIIGQLFLIIICYNLIALTSVFYFISKSIFIGLLIGAFLSFLIFNLYFINILDLEPRTLPTNSAKKLLFFSYFIKFFFITLFALFVIKSMEILIFKHIVNLSFEFNPKGSKIHKELIELHSYHPEIWGFTIANYLLFIAPIFLKIQLNRKEIESTNKNEKPYFQIKKEVDIFIVVEDYKKFKIHREKILNRVYLDYVKLNETFNDVAKKSASLKSLSHQYRIRKPKPTKETYLDPPFNTIKISNLKNQDSSSHEDYLNTLTNNGNLAEGN